MRLILGPVCMALMFGASLFGGGKVSSEPLFVIERSTNANVVHYDANLRPDGDLDPQQPISAYWVMAAEDGRREELSSFERSRAYGFTIEREPAANSYRLDLVAQKRRDIRVRREGEAVRAETTIAGRRVYLNKIYVSTRKVLAVPSVKYIELIGTDAATGELVSERVLP